LDAKAATVGSAASATLSCAAFRDRQQQPVRAVRRRHHAVVRGIQGEQVVAAQTGCRGGLPEMHLSSGIDGLEERLIGYRLELEAVGAWIRDDTADREQLRDVGARLGAQVQAEEVGRASGSGIALHGAAHVALTAVVGRDREEPVTIEILAQVLQVREGGIGRLDDVASLVEPPGLLQTEMLARARDELPETGCAAARIRDRVERALDDRQQREFHRHAAPVDLAYDVMQVTGATLENAVEVLGLGQVPLDLAIDGALIDIRQRESCADAVQHVGPRDPGVGCGQLAPEPARSGSRRSCRRRRQARIVRVRR
jgi:hypothetical protein